LNFNFDEIIPLAGSGSLKFDDRLNVFGRADVQPMWVADMDFAAPPAVVRALQTRAAHPVYGYTKTPENLYQALISWLQKRHRWQVAREQILLCPGVVPSLYAAVAAFTEPGDSVIVQPPVYFPFFSAVTTNGRRLVENPLLLKNGRYEMDFDHLEQCARNGAKLMLLCSPHNPVGRVWQRDELEQLLAIAERYDLIILADEIHADLVYPDFQHTALATLGQTDQRVVTAVAPSKTFNVPGLGLSALIANNPAHRKKLVKAFDQLHVSPGNPFSLAAFEAAYAEGEPWLDALLAYLQQTRDFVATTLQQSLPGIRLIPPQGTYLLWLDCQSLDLDDRQLQRLFVEQAGLGLSPGLHFGKQGRGFMRMNIATPRANVEQALQRLRSATADF
jgi:cystathionine beta-lyase